MAEKTRVDLDAFVAAEYPKVVAAVGLITGNRQDAADAVQDAIVGYLASPPEREIKNLAAWITVVATHRMRDWQRRNQAETRALSQEQSRAEIPNGGVTDVPRPGLDIDIETAIRKLPPNQRDICVLYYLLDQSVDTIAEGLGLTQGTIKTQLHRARKTLARHIRREDHRG